VVFCQDRDPNAYTGYEINMFLKVARVLGWEAGMLNWRCMDWDDMVQSLKDADGVCDIAVGGVEIEPANLEAGIVFTRPTYRYECGSC
jgi:ABC-type amino acid transport substrate-binding protein